ncbi:MAG TPA: hypothetical protein VNF28_04790 [Candidatus Binataceae bacterium]|nr:hypothetical protein [Candidatus Binataceae bacterium]
MRSRFAIAKWVGALVPRAALAGTVLAAVSGMLGAAMAASGCTRARTGLVQYFPLKPGMAWTFRFSGASGATGELTTTNQAPRKVFGFTAVPQQNAGGDKTYTEFYADDGAGIRHVAIDESEGLQSRLSDHSYVIKLPIAAGTSWREIDRTFDGTVYDATTRIESVSDNVSVPAGTFSGCIRIRSIGSASAAKGSARAPGARAGLRLAADDDEVIVEDYYWLAPGVGPVKATHQESRGEGPMAQSIDFTLELEHLKR